ncbi:uncharacterized protein LOC131319032 [Rhododendron vialii]|uniref:uncharacterized protein LOC131319032 n=1 Tax=Rhododendron vialii TaxID=182163 RepID=UPI00265FAC0D|nr:uncharacterized protein LOC131319032 [Rhododendron vialii]
MLFELPVSDPSQGTLFTSIHFYHSQLLPKQRMTIIAIGDGLGSKYKIACFQTVKMEPEPAICSLSTSSADISSHSRCSQITSETEALYIVSATRNHECLIFNPAFAPLLLVSSFEVMQIHVCYLRHAQMYCLRQPTV